ncbi:hypothetical protein SBF1_5640007 [Candidatus Desulfosporosinus infrequens]|uniref:Uncharacterized protein n=1 Tax=Candidatus Desulfosporosinus infrequens TaxID=2043169 RepID=A0A2U3LK72_9FIRM|nr:hypothetical protein SBF1_5640007 [Candidatus Desulfosporosinus infrequens]
MPLAEENPPQTMSTTLSFESAFDFAIESYNYGYVKSPRSKYEGTLNYYSNIQDHCSVFRFNKPKLFI